MEYFVVISIIVAVLLGASISKRRWLSDELSSTTSGDVAMNRVTEVPPASSEFAAQHFGGLLAVQTDCDDVHNALASGTADFILLDVRGPDAYAHGHVPAAINLPHREITGERMSRWPRQTVFVVYCAGPHCNGPDKAAHKLALLGRQVKVMIGGMKGWENEGFKFARGSEQESLQTSVA